MSDAYVQGVLGARGLVGARPALAPQGPMPQPGRNVQDVLAEEERPSVFESVFRFIGRPGFALRSLLAGDPEGSIRNILQFLNETALGGFLNQNLTLTSLVGGPRDLTSRAQRPEFTDLLRRWGVATHEIPSMGKLALDVAGGIVTDPLTLVGGAPKGLATGAVNAGKGSAHAGSTLANALKARSAGKVLNERFAAATLDVLGQIDEVAPLVARKAREAQGAARTAPVTRGMLQAAQARGLISPDRAAAALRGVEQKAGLKVLFDTMASEGIDLTKIGQGVVPAPLDDARALFRNPIAKQEDFVAGRGRFLFKSDVLGPGGRVDDFLPAVRQGIQDGRFKVYKNHAMPGVGAVDLVGRADDMGLAELADAITDPTRMAGALQRAGYADEWIDALLREGGLADTVTIPPREKWSRILADMPQSTINEGVDALRKAGMSPGGGLSFWVPGVKQADDLGSLQFRNGYFYAPWSSVGNALTLPGWVRSTGRLTGWYDATMFDATIADFHENVTRALYKRTFGGKLGKGMQDAAEAAKGWIHRRGQVLGRTLYGYFGDLVDPATPNNVGRILLDAEDDYHVGTRALGEVDPSMFVLPPGAHRGRQITTDPDRIANAGPVPVAMTQDPAEIGERLGQDMAEYLRLRQQSYDQLDYFTYERLANLSDAEATTPALRRARRGSRRMLQSMGALADVEKFAAARTAEARARYQNLNYSVEGVLPTRPDLGRLIRGESPNNMPVYGPGMEAPLVPVPGVPDPHGVAGQAAAGVRGTAGLEYAQTVEFQRDVVVRGLVNDATEATRHLVRVRRARLAGDLRGLDRARLAEDLPGLGDLREGVDVGTDVASRRAIRDAEEAARTQLEVLDAQIRALEEIDFAQPRAEILQGIQNVVRNELNRPVLRAGLDREGFQAALDHVIDVVARDPEEGLNAYQALRAEVLQVRRVLGEIQEHATAAMRDLTVQNSKHMAELIRANREAVLAGQVALRVKERIAAEIDPRDVPRMQEFVDWYFKAMSEIPPYNVHTAKTTASLRGRGSLEPLWRNMDRANPFYVPHQIEEAALEALDSPTLPAEARGQLQTVFDQKRTYATVGEFRAALQRALEAHGVDYVDDLYDPVETHIGNLAFKRLMAFERVRARQTAFQTARKLAGANWRPGGPGWDAYVRYLDGVFNPVSGPRGPLLALLGGGPIEFQVTGGRAARVAANMNRLFAADLDKPFATVTNEGRSVKFNFPGLNRIFKPAMTSIPHNLRFRARNNVSSWIMGLIHPEIGDVGAKQLWKGARDDGLVRWAIKHFAPWSKKPLLEWSDDAAGLTQALRAKDTAAIQNAIGDTTRALNAMTPEDRQAQAASWLVRAFTAESKSERMAAEKVLEGLNDSVGGYTWRQVIGHMREFLGDTISHADLDDGVALHHALFTDLSALSREPTNPNRVAQFLNKLNRYVEFGQQISNELEHRYRALAFLNALKSGKTPLQARDLVNRAFVDYSRNSDVERALRDVIPFARFMIGSTVWAKNLAERPSMLAASQIPGSPGARFVAGMVSPQGLGFAQRSLQGEESPSLPLQARDSIALPLPWKDLDGNRQFLISLGLPHESTMVAMSMLTSLDSIRRHGLGGTQPVLKLGGEALLDKSFYFGTEFGSYRKAPFLLRPFAKDMGDGKREVPGWLNELINASPFSTTESMISRLGDERFGRAVKTLNLLTGARVLSVDEQRELDKRLVDYLKAKVSAGDVGQLEVFFSRLAEGDVPEDLRLVLDTLNRERREARKRRERESAGP